LSSLQNLRQIIISGCKKSYIYSTEIELSICNHLASIAKLASFSVLFNNFHFSAFGKGKLSNAIADLPKSLKEIVIDLGKTTKEFISKLEEFPIIKKITIVYHSTK